MRGRPARWPGAGSRSSCRRKWLCGYNTAGLVLLDKAAAETGTGQALVDQGFKNAVVTHGEQVGIDVAIVERNPAERMSGGGQALGALLAGHPAYQQSTAVFAEADRPLRAREGCEAMDLPILPKHTGNIRSELERLADRGILAETEPGLFAQPRP